MITETSKQRVRNLKALTSFKQSLNSSLVIVALMVLVIVFSLAADSFLTTKNWFNILQAVTVVGILTIGQVFVIITAGIDISQGSVIGLSGVVTATLLTNGTPIWLAILVGIASGCLIGLVNGLLVAVAGMQPFIVTLGTMSLASGTALIMTNGQPIYGIPDSLSNFGSYGISIFPYMTMILIVMAILAHFVLSKTKFGRYTYAVGSNILSARLSGLNIKRQLVGAYLISGTTSAIGGVIMMAWISSALPTVGTGYELSAIAAVVIGGGSLFGGEGNIKGGLIGALLMAVLSNGSQLLGVSSYWQSILLGLVVLIAVYIDRFRRRTMSQ